MIQFLEGDALTVLKTLETESIHCCVTSPPYWGLRDYGTAKWKGGNSECDHKGQQSRSVSGGEGKQYTNIGSNRVYSGNCVCGAIRIDDQLGLEKTPEEYTAKLVEIFREVHRVLRKDGTLWLNLGDSYSGSGKGAEGNLNIGHTFRQLSHKHSGIIPFGLKPKDLVGIPWRVAFALQADGWYLRQDIIWAKPNPMPESVKDRCTKSHEYIFLLSKEAKYYFDSEAIKETGKDEVGTHRGGSLVKASAKNINDKFIAAHSHMGGIETILATGFRNKRSVWTVATKPYSGAHFATFPPKLIEPCILAGCPEGGIVLDPFSGAGTTALVCARLNRNSIGIELNPKYIEMAKERIYKEIPLAVA